MEKQELKLHHNYKSPTIANENSPALILLHGFGSDENDLFSFADELSDAYHIISLRAPLRLEPYGFAWYNIYFDAPGGKFSDDVQAIASRDLIVNCIDSIVEKYKVTYENITLVGFSQGTILALAIALSFPKKVKNVIALSGYINEAILKEGYKQNDFENLAFYTSHGSQDQVIPVQWGRKTKPFLDNLGIECSYSEFPVGHGVSPQNFYEMKDWLSKH